MLLVLVTWYNKSELTFVAHTILLAATVVIVIVVVEEASIRLIFVFYLALLFV